MYRVAASSVLLVGISLVVAIAQAADENQSGSFSSLRVAVAQIPVTRDIAANRKTIERAINRAVKQKAEILLTPEGSLSGYTPTFDQNAVAKALGAIVDRASSKSLALALGTCFVEADDGKCYNQIRFYDENGAFLGFHSKTLRCGSMDEPVKGEQMVVYTIKLD